MMDFVALDEIVQVCKDNYKKAFSEPPIRRVWALSELASEKRDNRVF